MENINIKIAIMQKVENGQLKVELQNRKTRNKLNTDKIGFLLKDLDYQCLIARFQEFENSERKILKIKLQDYLYLSFKKTKKYTKFNKNKTNLNDFKLLNQAGIYFINHKFTIKNFKKALDRKGFINPFNCLETSEIFDLIESGDLPLIDKKTSKIVILQGYILSSVGKEKVIQVNKIYPFC